jgi:hypothetical protein
VHVSASTPDGTSGHPYRSASEGPIRDGIAVRRAP